MKKVLLSFIFSSMALITYADNLVDYHFYIQEFRLGEHRYDFNVSKASGKGFISIDEDGSGYVYVEWNGKNNSFALGANELVDVEDGNDNIRLTYRYGSGEVIIEMGKYGAIVHYSYGDKYKIWKER